MNSGRISRVPPYSGFRYLDNSLRARGYHPPRLTNIAVPCPRCRRNGNGLGSSPFARHYWGNHCCFLLLRVMRCFSSPRSPPFRMTGIYPAGLPHSEIHGSRVTCTSPWPIAAYRVLHRLREPRHPPRALSYSRSLASCCISTLSMYHYTDGSVFFTTFLLHGLNNPLTFQHVKELPVNAKLKIEN